MTFQSAAKNSSELPSLYSQAPSQGSAQCQETNPQGAMQGENNKIPAQEQLDVPQTSAQVQQGVSKTPSQAQQGVFKISSQGQRISQLAIVQDVQLTAPLAIGNQQAIPLDNQTDQQTEVQPQQDVEDVPLDPKILEVMGGRFLEERNLAQAIPKELIVRWKEILNTGLPSEAKVALVKKYPPPRNGIIIDPPKINPEVRASLQEAMVKRDERILERQTKIAACLAAVGKTFLTVLDKYKEQDNLEIFEQLSDIGKLLADLQHEESAIRKSLILSNLNPSFKDVLNEATPDEFLFGNQLEEKMKAAKALETSQKELKPVQKSQVAKGAKNSKLPPRQSQYNQQRYQSTSGGTKHRDTKNQGSSTKRGNHQKSASNWKNNRKYESNSYQKRR